METLREKLVQSIDWHKMRSEIIVGDNQRIYKCWCTWESGPVSSTNLGEAFRGHQADMQMAVVAEHIAPEQENAPAYLPPDGASGYNFGIGYVLGELESDL